MSLIVTESFTKMFRNGNLQKSLSLTIHDNKQSTTINDKKRRVLSMCGKCTRSLPKVDVMCTYCHKACHGQHADQRLADILNFEHWIMDNGSR